MPAAKLDGGRQHLPGPRRSLPQLVGVQPDVERSQLEAEELDPAYELGHPPVRDAGAAILLEAARDDPQVLEQLLGLRVTVVAEAPPHERELAPVRLQLVEPPDLGGVRRQLALVTFERGLELGRDVGERAV